MRRLDIAWELYYIFEHVVTVSHKRFEGMNPDSVIHEIMTFIDVNSESFCYGILRKKIEEYVERRTTDTGILLTETEVAEARKAPLSSLYGYCGTDSVTK